MAGDGGRVGELNIVVSNFLVSGFWTTWSLSCGRAPIRHISGDHHGRTAGRAALLVTAADEILGTHR
jgi:hypothetical protein